MAIPAEVRAEVVLLIAEAMRPIRTDLTQHSEERVTHLLGDAQREIQRLENDIRQLREQVVNPGRGNDAARMKNMMDQKVFNKIEKYKDGHLKRKSLRTQIENLSELIYPSEGRRVFRWARSVGATNLKYREDGEVYNMMPPHDVTHQRAWIVSQDLAIALSYVLDGEADSILSNAGEGQGLDAWRRLQQRFDPKSNARDLVDSQRIVKPPQCKTLGALLPALEKWVDAVRHMNADSQPPPFIKMGIVISMCPPKLQDHLQYMEERLATYAQLRAEIIRKIDLAEMVGDHRSGSSGKSSNVMDIGSLQQQNSDPWSYPRHDHQPEHWDQPWGSQDNWSPMKGEVDLSVLQKGFKGKGKGKGEYKGKGKGMWGHWNPWNQFNKGDEGGVKGEKGDKKGFKGRGLKSGAPHAGKGYGNTYSTPPGVFNGHCHSCWGWGHSSRYCPRRQDANAVYVIPSETIGETPPSSTTEQDTIQLSSTVRSYPWGYPSSLYSESHGRQGGINGQYASQGWTPAQVRQGSGERHVRFGTVEVNHSATDNRYEPLGDSPGNDHDYVDLSALERISGCVELGSMATHEKQYVR